MKIVNRKAGLNYEIFDKFEAGVALTGPEVKSLFAGQASLDEAYIKFVAGEAFLLNAHIHPYAYADIRKIDPKRTRKLLLHRTELLGLTSKMKQKKLILIPLSWYNRGTQIKLEIALARPRKRWEKKEVLRRRDLVREAELELASR